MVPSQSLISTRARDHESSTCQNLILPTQNRHVKDPDTPGPCSAIFSYSHRVEEHKLKCESKCTQNCEKVPNFVVNSAVKRRPSFLQRTENSSLSTPLVLSLSLSTENPVLCFALFCHILSPHFLGSCSCAVVFWHYPRQHCVLRIPLYHFFALHVEFVFFQVPTSSPICCFLFCSRTKKNKNQD